MNSTARLLRVAAATSILLLGALVAKPTAVPDELPPNQHWVGTWGTPAMMRVAAGANENTGSTNQTLRQIVPISLGGSQFRVRLSNAFGTKAVTVGEAHMALPDKDAAIKPGSDRTLTFGGAKSTTLWPGAVIQSDPVAYVPALANLAISLSLPDDVPSEGGARQASYVTGVEVAAPRTVGAIVAFGDSLTAGAMSWPATLTARLHAAGMRMGVINMGTGGSRVLHRGNGDSGLQRFDRDVLVQSGVTHVIAFLGINDLRFMSGDMAVSRNRPRDPNSEKWPTAEDMIAGYKQLILRAHTKGLKIYGATLLPWENGTFVAGAYTPEGAAKHRLIVEWIRNSGAFDAVIDFNKLLQDPAYPTRMLPMWDSGDHLHPGPAGYRHMGESIDLSLFKLGSRRRAITTSRFEGPKHRILSYLFISVRVARVATGAPSPDPWRRYEIDRSPAQSRDVDSRPAAQRARGRPNRAC